MIILRILTIATILLVTACAPKKAAELTAYGRSAPSINAMAPLLIGDPKDPEGAASAPAWAEFTAHLQLAKSLGIKAISTDVWWGLVEEADNEFEWRYYDKLSAVILAAGLEWVPILSFHQCGGNVGDTCDIKIPQWLFRKIARAPFEPDDYKFKSEQGHVSHETISVWATDAALQDYRELMVAFRDHFRRNARQITEVNVSLGPAGELRYPSYNSHDQGTGFPTRGGLQAYSKLAVADFQRYMSALVKGDAKMLSARWGRYLQSIAAVAPPSNAEDYFSKGGPESFYGLDFHAWYQSALVAHGEKILKVALETFGDPKGGFAAVEIGAKIPGIHWRMGSKDASGAIVFADRYAEMAAGLIQSDRESWRIAGGYAPLISLFGRLNGKGRLILHFTCLEMKDGQDPQDAKSLPQTLVGWVGSEATKQRVTLKGENALGWNVPNADSWDRMAEALAQDYSGLTILRISDIAGSQVAQDRIRQLTGAR